MTVTDKLLTPGISHGRPMRKLDTPGNKPAGVVIHYVGNPGSSADGNRNYFENGSGGAGVAAHYIIGLKGEVLRCVPDDEVAYHAGKSFGPTWDAMSKTNNFRMLGIECCHPDASGAFNDQTYASVVELSAALCKKYGLGINQVYRHYDVCGKMCPLYYAKNQSAWQKMKSDISAKIGVSVQAAVAAVSSPAAEVIPISAAAPVPVVFTTKTPIMNKPTATVGQMKIWARNRNAAPFFVDLADTFYEVSVAAGVDPVVTYTQSAKETGNGRFGGVLDESYCNPCGMKTSQGGGDYEKEAHKRFSSWVEGIAAEVDHLALYAGAPGYPKYITPDPRHFASIKGLATTVEELGGRWAPSKTYGVEIVDMMKKLQATKDDSAQVGQLSANVIPMPPVQQPKIEPKIEPKNESVISNTPSDWAQAAWEWAISAGITDGSNPRGAPTREQVVTMIWAAFYKPPMKGR